MNHHNPIPLKECIHEALSFGSGDYYLICDECGRYWVMVGNNGDEPDPSQSNIGAAASLSGERRVTDINAGDNKK